jgi:hypothetical protein
MTCVGFILSCLKKKIQMKSFLSEIKQLMQAQTVTENTFKLSRTAVMSHHDKPATSQKQLFSGEFVLSLKIGHL